jgi:type IV pilus assembly protein PilW
MMAPKSQRGVTLVELMISIVIALLLSIGLVSLFAQNKRSYYQNEDLARMQDNGRYATEQLARDLSMAGFYGQLSGPTWFVPSALPAQTACGIGTPLSDDLAIDPGAPIDWLYAIFPRGATGISDGFVPQQAAISVVNNAVGTGRFACIGLPAADLVDGSDLLAIKRVIGTPVDHTAALPANRIYLGRRGSDGFLAQGSVINATGALQANPDPLQVTARDYEYSPRVYYVRTLDFADDELPAAPTLCRRILEAGPQMVEECLADGIETFQVEFGLDLSGDGNANVYVSGLDPNPPVGTIPPDPEQMLLVSARVYVLARTLRPDPTYTNDKTYTLGDRVVGPFNDRFYRRVFTTTVMVRNVKNLQRLGF